MPADSSGFRPVATSSKLRECLESTTKEESNDCQTSVMEQDPKVNLDNGDNNAESQPILLMIQVPHLI